MKTKPTARFGKLRRTSKEMVGRPMTEADYQRKKLMEQGRQRRKQHLKKGY